MPPSVTVLSARGFDPVHGRLYGCCFAAGERGRNRRAGDTDVQFRMGGGESVNLSGDFLGITGLVHAVEHPDEGRALEAQVAQITQPLEHLHGAAQEFPCREHFRGDGRYQQVSSDVEGTSNNS